MTPEQEAEAIEIELELRKRRSGPKGETPGEQSAAKLTGMGIPTVAHAGKTTNQRGSVAALAGDRATEADRQEITSSLPNQIAANLSSAGESLTGWIPGVDLRTRAYRQALLGPESDNATSPEESRLLSSRPIPNMNDVRTQSARDVEGADQERAARSDLFPVADALGPATGLALTAPMAVAGAAGTLADVAAPMSKATLVNALRILAPRISGGGMAGAAMGASGGLNQSRGNDVVGDMAQGAREGVLPGMAGGLIMSEPAAPGILGKDVVAPVKGAIDRTRLRLAQSGPVNIPASAAEMLLPGIIGKPAGAFLRARAMKQGKGIPNAEMRSVQSGDEFVPTPGTAKGPLKPPDRALGLRTQIETGQSVEQSPQNSLLLKEARSQSDVAKGAGEGPFYSPPEEQTPEQSGNESANEIWPEGPTAQDVEFPPSDEIDITPKSPPRMTPGQNPVDSAVSQALEANGIDPGDKMLQGIDLDVQNKTGDFWQDSRRFIQQGGTMDQLREQIGTHLRHDRGMDAPLNRPHHQVQKEVDQMVRSHEREANAEAKAREGGSPFVRSMRAEKEIDARVKLDSMPPEQKAKLANEAYERNGRKSAKAAKEMGISETRFWALMGLRKANGPFNR